MSNDYLWSKTQSKTNSSGELYTRVTFSSMKAEIGQSNENVNNSGEWLIERCELFKLSPETYMLFNFKIIHKFT